MFSNNIPITSITLFAITKLVIATLRVFRSPSCCNERIRVMILIVRFTAPIAKKILVAKVNV